jgi:hypothetical protein
MMMNRVRAAGPRHQAGQLAEALVDWSTSSSASSCTPRTCPVEQGYGASAKTRSWKGSASRSGAQCVRSDLVYTVGKLMLLKLRQDIEAAAGQGVFASRVP